MRIFIDDKIPYVKGVFEPYAEVEYLPGGLASPGKLRHADALLIRTRTLCNETSLAQSRVRFIATATIGYDHIDTDYCRQNGIVWKNAAGCNADSVAMYVGCALKHLAQKYSFNLKDKALGIVGLGHVGEKVAAVASQLGCRVLKNDPLRQSAMLEGKTCSDNGLPYTDRAEDYISLDELMARADIISLHPNLHHEAPYASYHLFDEQRLSQMQKHQILINASRGEVVDNEALKKALQHRSIKAAVLDVWENEPQIDQELLRLVDIATPHIAGYAIDGKANGSTMSVQAIARFFSIEDLYHWTAGPLPESTPPYDILLDDAALRQSPESFEALRPQAAITKVLSQCGL
ncbi:MAG: 4-phosphoerythronate dehydrogenase [Bacteroidales bacterium]|nr:4-phosphoerythronate dehydrogenase [Bacteroidales bacterium]